MKAREIVVLETHDPFRVHRHRLQKIIGEGTRDKNFVPNDLSTTLPIITFVAKNRRMHSNIFIASDKAFRRVRNNLRPFTSRRAAARLGTSHRLYEFRITCPRLIAASERNGRERMLRFSKD
jgi:hypothetical protein